MINRARRAGVALALALSLLGAGCGDDGSPERAGRDAAGPTATAATPTTTTTTAPATPPGPGTVVERQRLDEPGTDGSVWRVRYRSLSVAGEPVEVTGIVARPDGPAPRGGFPVLAWAHGTTGVADDCAPSRSGAASVPGLQTLLDSGFVVAATDYEGLGTPGVHPYLVSVSEGRGVLDAARAAIEVADGSSSAVVVVGHSQGGHAALAAAEIAIEWAPELDVAGTVAIAPAADVGIMMPVMFGAPGAFGFGALVAAGWTDAYDELDETDVLTPAGMAIADVARERCLGDVFEAVGGQRIDELVATPPHELPDWQRRIDENSIAADRVAGPVLVVHGVDDPVVPLLLSDLLVESFCAAGVPVAYRTYVDQDHSSVVEAATEDIERWARDRLAGEPPPSTCGSPPG